MAFNTKYKLIFNDYFKAAWTVEIKYLNYAGDVIELTPASSPLVFHTGKDSTDKMEPFMPSSVDINIAADDTDVEAMRDDLFVSSYSVQVYISCSDNSISWQGWLMAEYCEYVLTDLKFVFKISATDGISTGDNKAPDLFEHLNGRPPQSVGLPDKGDFVLIDELFCNLISSVLALDTFIIFFITTLRFNDDTDLFNDLYINIKQFYDKGKFNSSKSILETLLRSFGMRMLWTNGIAYITSIEDLGSTGLLTFYQYSIVDGAIDSKYSSSISNIYTLSRDNAIDGTIVQQFAQVQLLGNYNEYSNELSLKEFTNLIGNARFRYINTTTPYTIPEAWQSWDAPGSPTYPITVTRGGTGTADDPYYMRLGADGANSISGIAQELSVPNEIINNTKNGFSLSFISRVKVDGAQNSEYKILIKAYHSVNGDDIYYSFVNNAWQGSKPNENFDNYFIGGYGRIITVNVDIPPIRDSLTQPIRDSIYIEITGPQYDYVDIFFVELLPKSYLNRESLTIDLKSKKEWATNPDPFKGLITLNDVFSNSIRYGGTADTSLWKSTKQPDGVSNLAEWLANATMNERSYPTESVNCNVLSNKLMFFNVLSLNDKLYIQMSDEYDVKSGIHNIKALQIKDNEFDGDLYTKSITYNYE